MLLERLHVRGQRDEYRPRPCTHPRNQLKMGRRFNVKCKSIKLFQDSTRKNPRRSWVWWCLFKKQLHERNTINSWTSLKLKFSALKKKIWSEKDSVKSMRRQATDWKNVFAKDTSENNNNHNHHLLSKIYKELLKLNDKKANNLITKWAKHLNRHLTKEDIQMTSKHMRRCSVSCIIREMLVKTTRYHCAGMRATKLYHAANTKCGWGCRATGVLIYCWWECKTVQPLWKTIWQFLIKLKFFCPRIQ